MSRRLILALTIAIIGLSLTTQEGFARLAGISGFCELESESDHSGTKVVFTSLSPSAVSDSTITGLAGDYSIGLAEGLYKVSFHHEGFLSHALPDDYLLDGTGAILPTVILQWVGVSNEISGPVGGVWSPSSAYHVTGDIWVESGDTLIIEAGTEIRFMGQHSLQVFGALYAAGTEADSVVFTSGLAPSAPDDWGSIQIAESPSGAGHLELRYCVVEYGGGVVANSGYASSGAIEHSYLRNNVNGLEMNGGSEALAIDQNEICMNVGFGIKTSGGGHRIVGNRISGNDIGIGIYHASPVIEGNEINENASSGISISGQSAPLVTGNEISRNGDRGIWFVALSSFNGTVVTRNTLASNGNYGIALYSGQVEVSHNTLVDNRFSIDVDYRSEASIDYNVIVDGILNLETVPRSLTYNDLFGITVLGAGPNGFAKLVTTNANADSCDTYYNIFLDPRFSSPDDFSLQSTSPCIDAGPAGLLDPDGTRLDLGAEPFYQGDPSAPAIDFSAEPLIGTAPHGVDFAGINAGGPVTSWLWNFGDGTTSTEANPVHTYVTDVEQTYSVSLSVTGPGGSDQVTKGDLITVLPYHAPPVAAFSASPLDGFDPVQFTDLSLGQPTEWLWDFGDGAPQSSEQNPAHAYAAGTYTVTLTVTNAWGEDSLTKEDYVTVREPEAVVAAFTASPTRGAAPLDVFFTDTSLGTIAEYSWDFGDGTTSDLQQPTHLFEEPGLYPVRLVIFGPANTDTAWTMIQVGNRSPSITLIADVPDDQGGWVYVTFEPSYHDGEPAKAEVYSLERRDSGKWINIMSGGATQSESYSFLAPTRVDSSRISDGLVDFRVVAAMDEGTFISSTASGYSVDNLPPAVPTSLQVIGSPEGVAIFWDPPLDGDFGWFNVYRAGDESLEPDGTELIASGPASEYLDENVNDGNTYYYRVSAVDRNGNEGDCTEPLGIVAPVSNLVVAMGARRDGGEIAVEWQLSDGAAGEDFLIHREQGRSGVFAPVHGSVTSVSPGLYRFGDGTVEPACTYRYRVLLEVADKSWILFTTDYVTARAARFGLRQNVPNPFNPSTRIAFELPVRSAVFLYIYDVSGRLVSTLLDGQVMAPGPQEVTWDGRTDQSGTASAGVYFYRLAAGDHADAKRMLLVK